MSFYSQMWSFLYIACAHITAMDSPAFRLFSSVIQTMPTLMHGDWCLVCANKQHNASYPIASCVSKGGGGLHVRLLYHRYSLVNLL